MSDFEARFNKAKVDFESRFNNALGANMSTEEGPVQAPLPQNQSVQPRRVPAAPDTSRHSVDVPLTMFGGHNPMAIKAAEAMGFQVDRARNTVNVPSTRMPEWMGGGQVNLGAAATGAADALTFGLTDDVLEGIEQVTPGRKGAAHALRTQQKEVEDLAPLSYLGGQIAGGVATAPATGVGGAAARGTAAATTRGLTGRAAQVAGRNAGLARGAVEAGGLGALDAAGHAEGDTLDRLVQTGIGGVAGGAFAAGLPMAGHMVGDAGNRAAGAAHKAGQNARLESGGLDPLDFRFDPERRAEAVEGVNRVGGGGVYSLDDYADKAHAFRDRAGASMGEVKAEMGRRADRASLDREEMGRAREVDEGIDEIVARASSTEGQPRLLTSGDSRQTPAPDQGPDPRLPPDAEGEAPFELVDADPLPLTRRSRTGMHDGDTHVGVDEDVATGRFHEGGPEFDDAAWHAARRREWLAANDVLQARRRGAPPDEIAELDRALARIEYENSRRDEIQNLPEIYSGVDPAEKAAFKRGEAERRERERDRRIVPTRELDDVEGLEAHPFNTDKDHPAIDYPEEYASADLDDPLFPSEEVSVAGAQAEARKRRRRQGADTRLGVLTRNEGTDVMSGAARRTNNAELRRTRGPDEDTFVDSRQDRSDMHREMRNRMDPPPPPENVVSLSSRRKPPRDLEADAREIVAELERGRDPSWGRLDGDRVVESGIMEAPNPPPRAPEPPPQNVRFLPQSLRGNSPAYDPADVSTLVDFRPPAFEPPPPPPRPDADILDFSPRTVVEPPRPYFGDTVPGIPRPRDLGATSPGYAPGPDTFADRGRNVAGVEHTLPDANVYGDTSPGAPPPPMPQGAFRTPAPAPAPPPAPQGTGMVPAPPPAPPGGGFQPPAPPPEAPFQFGRPPERPPIPTGLLPGNVDIRPFQVLGQQLAKELNADGAIGRPSAKAIMDQVRSMSQHAETGMPIDRAHELRELLDDKNIAGSNKVTDRKLRELRKHLSEAIQQATDDQGLGQKWAGANRDYALTAEAPERAAAAAKEKKNHLPYMGYAVGSLGAAAGGTLGAVAGGPVGGAAGLGIGMAAGAAANAYMRAYGTSIRATVLEKVAKQMASNPEALGPLLDPLTRAMQRGPAHFAAMVYANHRDDRIRGITSGTTTPDPSEENEDVRNR